MPNTNKLFITLFYVFMASISVSSFALAWGALGHQTVGEIAQRNLTAKGKQLVHEILGFESLAEAAIYPDLVRSDLEYKEFSSLHFIEMDPRFGGEYSKIPESLRPDHDAHSMISGIPEKLFEKNLNTPKFSWRQKMDLMRYLVHLVGDVHQPLHVGNGYDHGGNWCRIDYSVDENGKTSVITSNLHSFWDTTLVANIFTAEKKLKFSDKTPIAKDFKELADLIIKDERSLNTTEIKRTPILEWYKESQALHEKVYIDSLPVNPAERTYCMRVLKNKNGEVQKDSRGVDLVVEATGSAKITTKYIQESTEIVKSQIMKAGMRLAYLINTMAERESSEDSADFQAQKINELKGILEAF